MTVDMGSLSNLFPTNAAAPEASTSELPPPEPKVLITTSPGKPPTPHTRGFLEDLQALLGGKTRADVVPRRSPKFELGRVARWARKRGYGAIMASEKTTPSPVSFFWRDPLYPSWRTDLAFLLQPRSRSRSFLTVLLPISA